MDPKVTVILPIRNAEETLKRAIESIARQDMTDFECLLVDNGSSDRSAEIAAKWTAADQRFHLLYEPRPGVMYASNTGAWNAAGRYIARMDADDEAMPGRLRLQSDFLDRNPGYGAVAGLVDYCPDQSGREGFRRYVDWCNSVCSYREIRDRCFVESPVVNPSAMWRKEVFIRLGGYRDGAFPEDYELWLRWLEEGIRIAKIPEIVLRWYDSGRRLTRSDPRYSNRAFFELKSRYLARRLSGINPYHPQVVVMGAGRITRQRASFLEKDGIEITAFVDIKKTRKPGKRVIFYLDLPVAGNHFILSYVRQWDKREEVSAFLREKGYREGVDFLLVS